MNRISIKAKITLWYTLILLIISSIVLFVMVSVSREMLISDSEKKLTAAVEHMIPMVDNPRENPPRHPKPDEGQPPRGDFKKFPGFMFFNDGVHIAVYDKENNIIGGAIPFEFADEIEFIDSKVQEKELDGKEYLTYSKKVLSNEGEECWTVGVISIASESVLLKSVAKTNIILILILLCMAALGGYLILAQAFKPVEKIRNTAKHISESSDLSQRIALSDGKDEIYRLANTFDVMLDKIEKTLNNEKQFTSDASHELRTPVAVISSECEYALECAGSLEEVKESVLSIQKQNDKMSKLISNLLTISRMDRNAFEINSETVNISELLGFVCDEQEEIHGDTIKLERDISPDIIITSDSTLLARVFMNLISNAYSYSRGKGQIKVSLEEKEGEMIFKVSDNGIGIDKKDLPKIWERFYQVNPARTNSDGSMGLGLSMVKLIADKLGGSVYVESDPGVGSTFTFVMPEND